MTYRIRTRLGQIDGKWELAIPELGLKTGSFELDEIIVNAQQIIGLFLQKATSDRLDCTNVVVRRYGLFVEIDLNIGEESIETINQFFNRSLCEDSSCRC